MCCHYKNNRDYCSFNIVNPFKNPSLSSKSHSTSQKQICNDNFHIN